MRRWPFWMAAFGVLGGVLVFSKPGLGVNGRNPATWSLPQLSRTWYRRHRAKVAEARRRAGQVDLLFVGDSITQDYERAESPDYLNFRPVWDEFFAPHRALNLGFNADRTSNVLWRLRHGEVDGLAPANIVLLIGANNLFAHPLEPRPETSSQVTAGILAVVDELHQRMPAAKILVLSILPSGFSPERTAKTETINAQVKNGLAGLGYARWLDVSGLFLDRGSLRTELYYDPLLSPGLPALHPTAAGQRLMAEAVAKALYGS